MCEVELMTPIAMHLHKLIDDFSQRTKKRLGHETKVIYNKQKDGRGGQASLRETSGLLLDLSTNWMRPSYIIKSNLLYLKSAIVDINNIYRMPPLSYLDQCLIEELGTAAQPSHHIKLTFTGSLGDIPRRTEKSVSAYRDNQNLAWSSSEL